jgi:hypothetical protein
MLSKGGAGLLIYGNVELGTPSGFLYENVRAKEKQQENIFKKKKLNIIVKSVIAENY